jgi:tRNA U34 5-methylaminomethyl-2-thiouridine-forming methyltransferase MnmC
MERRIIKTADGSDTVFIPEMNVSYHSKHGAIQESLHVFIDAGFRYWSSLNPERQSKDQLINVFEMGFGTGLNAFLTAIEAEERRIKVYYEAVEQFPLSKEEVDGLNYTSALNNENLFRKVHECKWDEETKLNDFFTLKKVNENLINYSTNQPFDLIYYDAFAPTAQPELWREEVFKKLHSMLLPDGILVTYCSKGSVRRAMQAAGFNVEKIQGPPGKREMVRAFI